jgi:hypothetical protein
MYACTKKTKKNGDVRDSHPEFKRQFGTMKIKVVIPGHN